MNVQETTEIRELTAQELDHVNGGLFWGWAVGAVIGVAAAGVGIGALCLGLAAEAGHHN